MIKPFNSQRAVFGQVVQHKGPHFFFAQNCRPGEILCHQNQGGILTVSRAGRLAIEFVSDLLPRPGAQIAMILNESGTKADMWTVVDSWETYRFMVNCGRTFRAISYNHRTNGQTQKNTDMDAVVVEGMLRDINEQYPKNNYDTLTESRSMKFGSLLMTCNIRWERWDNNSWTECGDPRI